MQDNQLTFTVCENEYMTNWLTSRVFETPFEAEQEPMVFEDYHPGASVKTADGKECISPAKRAFLEKEIFIKSAYPQGLEINSLYWPFDTQRVDFSGFWHFPCDITFYAKAYVICDTDCYQQIELSTCGAMKIWVNGQEQAAFYPYESNLEARQKTVLLLSAGINEIVAGCNNYGERNIVFNFGIKNLGQDMQMFLPVGADIDRLRAINRTLEAMYLDRLSYDGGDIVICTDVPFPYNCILETNVCGIKRNLNMSRGCTAAVWGDADTLPIGYHEFKLSCHDNGAVLKKSLWAEVYPARLKTAPAKTLEERKQQALDFIVHNTQPGLEQYIAHLAAGENKFEEYKDIIEAAVTHVRKRGDCSDFRIVKILWILGRYRSLLTREQTEYFEDTLLRFRYWFDEKGNDAMWFFSENHALCFHTGQMIAGELFAERVFANSGRTGIQQSKRAKRLLVEWFEKLLAYGYNEWNSAAYIPVDILSYITLLELCKDGEVQELAKKALDYTYEIFAKNSFKGVLGTSSGRVYPRDLLANNDLTTNPLLWLAWGQGCLNSHADPLLFMVLSGYRSPEHLYEIACWDKEEKLIVKEEQGTYRVPVMLCKTKDYVLGTCRSPRTGGAGSQEHLLNVFLKDGQFRIWINHPGEARIFGEKRPGYFTGNGLTPLVSQQGNAAVMSYRFEESLQKCAEVDFTHAFCDISSCQEVFRKEKWVFIRKEDAFAALYSENGIQASGKALLKDKELVSPGINTTWFVKTAALPEIESFEAFVQWMLEHPPYEKNGKLIFHDFEYGDMEFELM